MQFSEFKYLLIIKQIFFKLKFDFAVYEMKVKKYLFGTSIWMGTLFLKCSI